MTDVDFEDVAGELYGLPPRAFTARRDQRVKEARAAGNRDLAERIGQLRKPTVSAWLANLLVRQFPEQVEALLDLGAAMREAQAALAGQDLLTLSRQRQQVVNALSRDARRLAAESGHPVGNDASVELEDTLRAALSEPLAAELLRGGRLTSALHPGAGGFGAGAGAGVGAGKDSALSRASRGPHPAAAAPDKTPASTQNRQRDRRAQQRTSATEALRRAERLVAEADRSADTAQHAVQRQHEQAERLGRLVQEVAAELSRVRAESTLCHREVRRLEAKLAAAKKTAAAARQGLSAARDSWERLAEP
jgi:hypothetical protein